KYEAGRKNRINREQAEHIFTQLRSQSHRAEEQKRESEIWIVFDPPTRMWKGFETPPLRESVGLPRNTKRGEQSKNSYRKRYEHQPPQSKASMLERIQEVGDVTED